MEQQPQIDLTNTESLTGENGNVLFGQAFIVRKISKFVAATTEDAYMPIPVFYDLESKKILLDILPPEIRDEYKDYSIES